MMDELQRATGIDYRRSRARLLELPDLPVIGAAADWRLRLAADALALWRSAP